jgi:hypothetical protein
VAKLFVFFLCVSCWALKSCLMDALECNVKTKLNVEQCFEELILKVSSDFQLCFLWLSSMVYS